MNIVIKLLYDFDVPWHHLGVNLLSYLQDLAAPVVYNSSIQLYGQFFCFLNSSCIQTVRHLIADIKYSTILNMLPRNSSLGRI